MTRVFLVLLSLAMFQIQRADGWDWPTFRGFNANGIASDSGLPDRWGSETNVQWTADIPGKGWSAPIVVGENVIVSTAVPEGGRDSVYRFEVHCFDVNSGKLRWKRTVKQEKPRVGTHRDNTYASETPVTDGKHIVVYFGMTGLYCFDLEGKILWEKDLGVFPMMANWGTASSPAMHDGLVFVQIDSEAQSFIAAYDVATGEQRWRIARDEKSNWSSPMIWKNDQRTELVVAGNVTRSYDPGTGKQLWELSMDGGRRSSSPMGTDSLLVFGAEDRSRRRGGAGGLYVVRSGASGDITPADLDGASSGVVWSSRSAAPGMASPVVLDGHVYVLSRNGGICSCYDLMTGELAYRTRLPGQKEFWASPWVADDKLFCLDASGATHVLAPGDEFQLIRSNQLDDGRFWASTAIAEGKILLRGSSKLFCISN